MIISEKIEEKVLIHDKINPSRYDQSAPTGTRLPFNDLVFFCFQPVGCDMRLNSGVKYDHCAVCGGDSSTCSFVSGLYTENYRKWGKKN